MSLRMKVPRTSKGLGWGGLSDSGKLALRALALGFLRHLTVH